MSGDRFSEASCVLQQPKPLVPRQSIATSQDLEIRFAKFYFPTADCLMQTLAKPPQLLFPCFMAEFLLHHAFHFAFTA